MGSSLPISLSLGWTLEGEYYDHCGALREDNQEESPLHIITADGSVEDGNGCWDLVEIYNDNNKVRGLEWGSALSES